MCAFYRYMYPAPGRAKLRGFFVDPTGAGFAGARRGPGGDVFSRSDVGSAGSTDHKTTARGSKLRPGPPHIPTRHGCNRATVPGWPGAAVGLQAARLQISRKLCGIACQNMSRSLFRWDEELATPIAGYLGTCRTPGGPQAPTWARAPNSAVVAVLKNRKSINS